jgi:leucyl-tRNA synthetase
MQKIKLSSNTDRRDRLVEIESVIEKQYEVTKPYQNNADKTKPKYMITFPYPYMNGRLHIGHLFTILKGDFMAGYQSLLGKNVLFPQGFHCTGTPIQAAAFKLKHELSGDISKNEKLQAKHKKLQTKYGDAKTQKDILLSIGVEESEVEKFTDPRYWLEYFPPKAMSDLQRFGMRMDFRRSFITTDANPHYDSFIKWQFNKLKEAGKVKFGKRMCVYSPLTGEQCTDHDRSVGEGVKPKEYTLIKMQVVGKDFLLLAATLRPETMYGQTNCFVKPDGEYKVYMSKDKSEKYCCSENCALNMYHQDLIDTSTSLASFRGEELIGLKLRSPLAMLKTLELYPMQGIDMKMGSGFVTSVPSEAPADYAELEKLKVKYQPIPIIHTDEYGDMTGINYLKKNKVKLTNSNKMEEAKKEVYRHSYHSGTMLLGDWKGLTVIQAQNKIRTYLCETSQAMIYHEPESPVISRQNDVCVAKLCDQWYLTYGETEWKSNVKAHLSTMGLYNQEAHDLMHQSFEWLNEWGCSRSVGLGTKLPFDPRYIIESLSDSTIYMAYYTVSHVIQNQITDVSLLTDKVWDYIFDLSDDFPEDSNILKSILDKCREEFMYWYSFDLRVSGYDLMKNHLTMSLYNHQAIWGDKYMPKSYAVNGHILIDGEKMSKSNGNFITMSDAIDTWGIDAVRFTLADSGDSVLNANFSTKMVEDATNKLCKELDYLSKYYPNKNTPKDIYDKIFLAQMDECVSLASCAYGTMQYREVLKHAFFNLIGYRDAYVKVKNIMKHEHCGFAMTRYIEVLCKLMWPICPHFSEYIWRVLFNNTTFIGKSGYPSFVTNEKTRAGLIFSGEYIEDIVKSMRKIRTKFKGEHVVCDIFYTTSRPDHEKYSLKIARDHYEKTQTMMTSKEFKAIIMKNNDMKKKMGICLGFWVYIIKTIYPKVNDPLKTLQDEPMLNEHEILSECTPYIKKLLKLDEIRIHSAETVESVKTVKLDNKSKKHLKIYSPVIKLHCY